MLTSRMCGEFDTLLKFFPDELDGSGNYDFKKRFFKTYCSSNNCDIDINKINAGCLWLFNKFYGDSENFSYNANDNLDIVTYIMTWLGYKLNQKLNSEFSNINEFYNKHMKNTDEYNNHITGIDAYSSYTYLINKEELINISNENVSKLYDLFKILCNMINSADKKDGGETCLKYADQFVDAYQKFINDTDIENSSYNKILSTLSNDYTGYGKQTIYLHLRNKLPNLITEKTATQVSGSSPKEPQDTSLSEMTTPSFEIEMSDSDSTSTSSEIEILDSGSASPSSSILNKLISIPFIFVVTLILLGIAYKYSLFGFRKRSQKQQIREKLKK
ncbi:uncharacterized protein PY17X_1042800 [Plasmodium yoelii]|uniref:PIR protein n=3 Tax=Plasmodium yoelii TaxID=5861 RepID=A0AAF0B4U2_PLAYO|nr:uncharacterized protein PY17X_1042800 [Plasmodium yoelii]EAA17909.1 putative bir1 protein [Plasmodium yoelii yoelii]WBY58231.1 PIR protein [Plasmodium yoelii yoelii]CDU85257.1 YIR protein [Plasmodium yoelii]VTZ79152.1 PIR protein [Plasmodium yoelii]|eukprot:XP_726344.1 uncharacterized protein PY17X_1042800 [Plasmodium yoelii]